MRLFIAIDINENARKAIAALQQELKTRLRIKGIKWVEPENMHLTLKFLGDVDENSLDEIFSILEIACSGRKPFEIIFSVVGVFGRPSRVLWLGCAKQSDEIVRLAADVDEACFALGFQKETRPFSTHLTLARIKDNIDRVLQKVLPDYNKVNIPKISADAVCLYKSQLTDIGPLYTLLKRIELI